LKQGVPVDGDEHYKKRASLLSKEALEFVEKDTQHFSSYWKDICHTELETR